MATFQEAQSKALLLTPEKITDDYFRFIRSIEPYLVELNRNALFVDSEDVFGDPIGFYSKATEIITRGGVAAGTSRRVKVAGEPFDMFEDGEFLGGLYAETKNQETEFGTRDLKKEAVLENTESPDLFGLRDDDLRKVISERISPFILEYFNLNLI